MKKSSLIINIINFIRGVEPRFEIDLIEPVRKQLELVDKHNLPASFLFQHDALIDTNFTKLFEQVNDNIEIGGWFEITQTLVDRVGLKWNGRYPWDWHCNVGFPVGYKPEERIQLVDAFMQDFQNTFGFYPKSVGSWFIDAVTLAHMGDKYGVIASCNCKDQYGTDGYTLWGGYWNQAYYPSRQNSFMPAQDETEQIKIPVFRMLGSDPIDQYDIVSNNNGQLVATLEPVSKAYGGNPEWIDWFFNGMQKSESLNFNYIQVGQENSFGWDQMKEGLTYQIQKLAEIKDTQALRIEQLCDSGRWFLDNFKTTPATSIVSKKENKGSIWYNSKYYRVNFYWDRDKFCIRDIHLFKQNMPETFLHSKCQENFCKYETLPVIDGYLWSSSKIQAGASICTATGMAVKVKSVQATKMNENSLSILLQLENDLELSILCSEDNMCLLFPESEKNKYMLLFEWDSSKTQDSLLIDSKEKELIYSYEGNKYTCICEAGLIGTALNQIICQPKEKMITFRFL